MCSGRLRAHGDGVGTPTCICRRQRSARCARSSGLRGATQLPSHLRDTAKSPSDTISDCDKQSSSSVVFTQAFDVNHLVTRSLTVFENDRAFWDVQFFSQKTTQSSIRFPFYRRGAQFDLDRIAVLADDFVALRIWHYVEL